MTTHSLLQNLHTIRYDTIRYDSVYLTCSKKLTNSQLNSPHGTNKNVKEKLKNKLMSIISHHIQEFQMFKNGLQFLVHPVNMCLFTSFKIRYFFALRRLFILSFTSLHAFLKISSILTNKLNIV